jgi:hypothetical protein
MKQHQLAIVKRNYFIMVMVYNKMNFSFLIAKLIIVQRTYSDIIRTYFFGVKVNKQTIRFHSFLSKTNIDI